MAPSVPIISQILLCICFAAAAAQPASAEGTPDPGDGNRVRGRVVDIYETPRFSEADWPVEGEFIHPFNLVSDPVALDATGDGRDDVFLRTTNESGILLVSEAPAGFRVAQKLMLEADEEAIGAGDVSGDGCADILLWAESRKAFRTAISNCNGLFRLVAAVESFGGIRKAFVEPAVGAAPAKILFLTSAEPAMVVVTGLSGGAPADIQPSVSLDDSQRGTAAPPFAANIDGDAGLELLVPFRQRYQHHLLAFGHRSGSGFYAVLPVSADDAAYFPAQLKGDGRTDILVQVTGSGLESWFAILSRGDTGFETAIENPFRTKLDHVSILPGDFNGDGFTDLLAVARRTASAGGRPIHLAMRIPPAGLPGVTVRAAANGESVVTNGAGEFTFPLRPERTGAIAVSKVGFAFHPKEIDPSGAPFGLRLRFAGAQVEGDPAVVGREQTLVGAPTGPSVCLGFHPLGSNSFDRFPTQKWGTVSGRCPNGYAVRDLRRVVRTPTGKLQNPLSGICCRLPRADILTGTEILAENRCPDGFIATGFERGEHEPSPLYQLRCAAVNADRYQLRTVPGTFWGLSFAMRGEGRRISAAHIPAALRAGIAREEWRLRNSFGCVGAEGRGLVLGVEGRTCREHSFGVLEYRGAAGDPPAGTAVPMVPACRAPVDIYNPLSGCVAE